MVMGLMVVAIGLTGCGRKVEVDTSREVRRHQLDSLGQSTRDTTQLNTLIKVYHDHGDRLGEMVLMRYLGKLYREENKFGDALRVHMNYLHMAEEERDTFEMVQALNNIGTNYRRLSILDVAQKYHYRALETSMACSDTTELTRKNTLMAANGLGNVYIATGNLRQAQRYFRFALQGEIELRSLRGQAMNYASLGNIYRDEEKGDSARLFYQKALQLNTEINDRVGISLCHTYLGTLYERQKDYAKAVDEYETAYLMMSDSNDHWHFLESCIALARVHMLRGMSGTAMEYLREAEKLAMEIHSPQNLSKVYNIYYDIYRKGGNYRQALNSYIDYKRWKDSVLDIGRLNAIQNQQLDVAYHRSKETVDKIRQSLYNEKKVHNLVFWGSSAAILVLIAVAGLFYYLLRMRTRGQQALRDLQEARNRFFTNITHEFRTPLTVIQAAGDDICNSTSDQQIVESVHCIQHSGQKLLGLVNQILDIAKLTHAETAPLTWIHNDIVGYVRNLVEGYVPLAQQRGVQVVLATKHDRLEMDFVPENMRKIVDNLVANALKFAFPNTSVIVSLALDKQRLRLEVKDRGRGIPPAALPHIFEPFYEAENNSSNIGTGVGLSLVKLAVDTMGGEIKVRSRMGEGSTFTVWLPLGQEPNLHYGIAASDYTPAAPIEPEGSLPADAKPQQGVKRPRILIVEDSVEVARYEASSLKGDYDIFYAADGEQGAAKAKTMMPDLVITDVMMPVSDGFALCEAIRSEPTTAHIPIIMITAKVTHEDRVRGIGLGADAYIEKPFKADELNVWVRKLLEQSQHMAAAPATTAAAEAATSEEKAFVEHFEELVKLQLSMQTLDLNAIAEQMGVSRTQLNRRIKALTGLTSSGYVAQIRQDMAKLLLQDTALPMGEVAQRCGINDVAYFSQLFKRIVGKTPKQYRDEWARLK